MDWFRTVLMDLFRTRTERVEQLRRLIDRLCASDLTLVEAKIVRLQLAELLATADPGSGWDADRARPLLPAPDEGGQNPGPGPLWS